MSSTRLANPRLDPTRFGVRRPPALAGQPQR